MKFARADFAARRHPRPGGCKEKRRSAGAKRRLRCAER